MGGRRTRAARGRDPRQYVDLVLDDEFPLSIFYASLKAKLTSEGVVAVASVLSP